MEKNSPIILLVLIVLFMIVCSPKKEKFSDSGLSISDKYCMKLGNVYLRPDQTDPECRSKMVQGLCGKSRRSTVGLRGGNYFTQNGVFI